MNEATLSDISENSSGEEAVNFASDILMSKDRMEFSNSFDQALRMPYVQVERQNTSPQKEVDQSSTDIRYNRD